MCTSFATVKFGLPFYVLPSSVKAITGQYSTLERGKKIKHCDLCSLVSFRTSKQVVRFVMYELIMYNRIIEDELTF